MELHLIYLCIGILVFIAIISIYATILKKERYVLLGKLGKTKNKKNKIYRVKGPPNKSKSLKYKDHRYERHHIRSNPHIRRYQDSF